MVSKYNEGVASIRNQILAYLKTNQKASVADLAAALAVTKADVRYHLKPLIRERLVETSPDGGVRSPRRRGRPAALFQLTEKANPDNYQNLAAVLLKLYLTRADRSSKDSALELARLMFNQIPPSQTGLIQGLNWIVAELNQYHYRAHWEARRDGPGIFFENCPYASILPVFPQLCDMDTQFLSQSSGLSAVQLQRIDNSLRRPPACVFRLIKS